MRSILLAVGCDRYDSLNPLSGAEADAERVFAALTAPGQPYAKETSRLLLSPTKGELERALLEIGTDGVEVLTFYFAGHGGAKEGGYYFCLKDSHPDRLSLTAYPLNSWLNVVKEVRPRYTYLIADSCQSGGTHHDIRDLLNDPRLGQHSASTFACLAAAASDQYASEINGAGVMTAELLKVFDGRLLVGTEQEELDLTEVGRVIGQQFEEMSLDQRPVAWGLNLFGPGRLCRNPHFAKSTAHFHIPEIPVGSVLAQEISRNSDALWEMYRSAARGINAEEVRTLVARVSGKAEIKPADRAAFVYGLARAMVGRLTPRGTPWEEAEALGVFAVCLLRDVRCDATAAAIARELLVRKTRLELDLIGPTLQRLTDEPRCLLNSDSRMADFFYLPLRLLKLLAATAHAVVIAPALGLTADPAAALALVRRVLATYPLAFKAVSDEQGPAFYLWAHFARQLGWQDELETIFGSVFSDFISVQGCIARCGLKPEQACEYLLARGTPSTPFKPGWLANPGQLLVVLLLVANENGLADSVDPFLEAVDHQRLNLYLPEDYLRFGDAVMEDGVNHTHEIGHDVWSCADFRSLFAADWKSHAPANDFPQSDLEHILVTCASLVYPNRIPLSLQGTP
jgi:hypothetical protein